MHEAAKAFGRDGTDRSMGKMHIMLPYRGARAWVIDLFDSSAYGVWALGSIIKAQHEISPVRA